MRLSESGLEVTFTHISFIRTHMAVSNFEETWESRLPDSRGTGRWGLVNTEHSGSVGKCNQQARHSLCTKDEKLALE